MLLHTDIPTRAQVGRLMDERSSGSVSIYLPTDPVSTGDAERVLFENHADDALRQVHELGLDRRVTADLEDHLADVADDPDLWVHLARSLAVFATAEAVTTFRLPNRLSSRVAVADRFHLIPLLRSLTFPHLAYVLALAQNSVRLLEVLPDAGPYTIAVPDLPRDIADAVHRPSVRGRAPRRRLQGSEGRKVRMGQYARVVDQAVRPVLGERVPLVLAAAEPLASIYRATSTYPHLARATLPEPEGLSEADLAAQARSVLDELYAEDLEEIHALYEQRAGGHRSVADLAEIARAATYGLVDTLLVDLDVTVAGTVDADGAVILDDDRAGASDVVDEVVRRVWRNGGRVLAVRGTEVPGGGAQAAILRYSPFATAPGPVGQAHQ